MSFASSLAFGCQRLIGSWGFYEDHWVGGSIVLSEFIEFEPLTMLGGSARSADCVSAPVGGNLWQIPGFCGMCHWESVVAFRIHRLLVWSSRPQNS